MDDDVERVAQLLMDMDGDGRGYEDMARAAMAATLELTAADARKNMSKKSQWFTDWLQQRAAAIRAIGAP
jgi:hypothetical protein